MSTFIQQIEAVLLPAATQYTSEGTEPKALAHQWMHALAYGFSPFAVVLGCPLLTRDVQRYQNYFPSVKLITP